DNILIHKYLTQEVSSPRLQLLVSTVAAWKTNFDYVDFHHVKRHNNSCADLLAKKAIVYETD
ncbi:hypothetical protein F2Q68_00011421, partial [Brassica cretica]